MSVDERHRAELFELLVPTMGREATVRLVEALPPAGEPLATVAQVQALERGIDGRFDLLEQRMDDRIDGLRDELVAVFRGQLVTAVSGQTRHIIVAVATAVLGIGGLAVTLAQVL